MNTATTQPLLQNYHQKVAALPSMQFKYVWGGFQNELEKEFYGDYFSGSLNLIRVTESVKNIV